MHIAKDGHIYTFFAKKRHLHKIFTKNIQFLPDFNSPASASIGLGKLAFENAASFQARTKNTPYQPTLSPSFIC